ncbi:metallophosphoesterase family protein [Sediminibacillus albus]|uniref:Phosphoesterase n=1 Tax=Sediminibacillus albus TaxID=407036 RepID=A0A1G9CD71_9BACI|nr:metallophosphoesterase [Sediminibacillus albus]SDK49638.1 hypothetical protein SAMN05216243_3385 [Sediminibacillus albus]
MKVAIISDTHMPRMAKQLPSQLKKGLEQVDLILHAGDWQANSVWETLEQYAPVKGVAGNVDDQEIQEKFGEKKILELNGFKVGLIHGDGKGLTTERRALTAFKKEDVDIIIFGHSHIPVLKEIDGITLFNPGSPTDKRRQPQFSYGMMELGDSFTLKHIFYDDKQ